MHDLLINSNIYTVLILLLTGGLIANDRVFPKKTRINLYIALGMGVLLMVSDIYECQNSSILFFSLIGMAKVLMVVFLLTGVLEKKQRNQKLVTLAMVLGNAILYLLNLEIKILGDCSAEGGFEKGSWFWLPVATILIYISYLLYLLWKENVSNDRSIYSYHLFLFIILLYATITEIFAYNPKDMNEVLCILTCLFCFERVIQTYKCDALTKLAGRYTMTFEMEELQNTPYFVSLLDVDNFKLINDKYGHHKGDQALVEVVETIRGNLLPKSKMFRYGGDEFIILSRNTTKEELFNMFKRVNELLEEKELRVSFGIAEHTPGRNSEEVLVEADEEMYNNKKKTRQENIWDDMTGLYNYRGFIEEMDSLRKGLHDDEKLRLICVDVEHLGNINMAYGYTEGNMVITAMARVLRSMVKGRDIAGHLGSDEFCIVLENKGGSNGTEEEFIEKIRQAVDKAYEFIGKEYTIELNFGDSEISGSEKLSTEECINRVLNRKQEEKENRRKSYVVDEVQEYDKEEEEQVLDLLKNNRLTYAFQPIVSASDGQIVAYEALMRTKGDIKLSPLTILKYAAKNNKSYEVEKLTFSNVLEYISKETAYDRKKRIFINSIPGSLLTDFDYNCLQKKYQDYMNGLVVEITEQRELQEKDLTILQKRRNENGFQLAIDDFGSGCSNTNSLLRYMPNVIKLDRLLITDIDKNSKKQFFVNSIIEFARENTMLVLAEGVETEEELKMVLHLGVDLIQGYYTAKPCFEMIESISDDVVKLIVDENLKMGENENSKVYVAGSDGDISLVALALEDYTNILISTKEATILGNKDYTAEMCIRIKEGQDCNLTLQDVKLDAIEELPCIDICEGANLTLNLVGESSFNTNGIHVAEGSSLTIVGAGHLKINAKGQNCYGIGVSQQETVGSIVFRNSGLLDIKVDGEKCIAIGGGYYRKGAGIDVGGGGYNLQIAGVDAIGVGCIKGDMPIRLLGCAMSIVFNVAEGCVIGSKEGKQNIICKNFSIDIKGSGSKLSALGSTMEGGGSIYLNSGTLLAKLNGQKITMVGSGGGEMKVTGNHVRLEIIGEGDQVLGVGSLQKLGSIAMDECNVDIVINSANPLGLGAEEENIRIEGPITKICVNGEKEGSID